VDASTINTPRNRLRRYCAERAATVAALPDELYTAAQVRVLDRRAIAAGTPGIVLMRRAAAAVLAELQCRWPSCKSVLVCCGGGNNGGDGYLFARLAHERGIGVTVLELGQSLVGDAATARQALIADGIQPVALAEVDSFDFASSELIVDALLGTGLTGELRADCAEVIARMNAAAVPIIAVDLPSGLCSDTGNVVGSVAIEAALTVSFIGLKRGLLTSDAACHVGELIFTALEVEHRGGADAAAIVYLAKLEQLAKALPARLGNHYKNRSGHLLVVGGDYGMPGAPLLAARNALRCGAGLVSVATRPEHVAAIVAAQPELMVHGIEKTADLDALLEHATVVVIGPGLGQGAWSGQLLQRCKNHKTPFVIDADALNLVARYPSLMPVADAVLTPHTGEARRLLDSSDPMSPSRQVTDRFIAAATLLERYQKTIVLKGPGTIVASLHRTCLSGYGNQALATAGTGDVLSGVIGALLAQGLSTGVAAELGVCLHGAAADRWVASHGSRGMVAGDLTAQLTLLLNRLI
jgi:hydroxyethylthiazole kinase-like uncharacterized protein yjeF